MTQPSVTVDPDKAALLVVDMQPDFMPGGPLAAPEGDALVRPVSELMASGLFRHIVATQDWHPADHVSFASQQPGRKPFESIELYGQPQVLWPDHCVQGTPGAALHPDLDWRHATLILRKATDPGVDSYSAFRSNHGPDGSRPPTGLTGYLRDHGVTQVFLCGLARDYCVKWSAEDGAAEGFDCHFLWDLTRAVDPAADESVRADLSTAGVSLIESRQLTAKNG
ncbi:nicotinamidase/pyrazinamidase [Alkalispirillum mobile]|uniref:nicotinamidase n=1 Tax=Alkalispirillum mobile TaxID=85925 RepID=A0A498C7X0_9GAMM|nr:bifunctional nicotinamidase/pyrazinamidase [Alkalispirillum mobile]RLK50226.1 nicotinamidase/pyrazinamidase [Alkalispirillum mobile]